MNRFFSFFIISQFFFLCCQYTHAQGQWMWVNGSQLVSQPPNFGTKGIATSSNTVGGRDVSTGWVDLQGNFWLYGGITPFQRGDLWKYDPINNLWTWVSGSSALNQKGVYGTKGIPAITNYPGSRYGSMSWRDLNGDLWLFGGTGFGPNAGYMNDLWKYSITNNTWTWMAGDSLTGKQGSYGSKGVFAPTNNPPCRGDGSSCRWTDNNGDFWLFGGYNSGTQFRNDLWKYSTSLNQWVWVNGDSTYNKLGIYGTINVPNAANKPGARSAQATWTDINGNLWLFGGTGYNSVNYNVLDDLWKYDPSTNNWTWMNGSNNSAQQPVYGMLCVPSTTNRPGFRNNATACWTDNCGNLYLYGGNAFADYRADLWRYNIATNQWTWISGDNVPSTSPVYGTQGILAPTNKPGARLGAVAWKNNDGLWFFGGSNNPNAAGDGLEDIWKYVPDTPSVGFSYSENSCMADFTNASQANCNIIKSIRWDFDDPTSGINNSSSIDNPAHNYGASGTYSVELLVESCFGKKDSLTDNVIINPLLVNAGNDITIIKGESTQLNASNAATYSWIPLEGLSCNTCPNPIASPTITTTYYLTASNSSGCDGIDSVTVFVEKKCNDVFIPNVFSPNNDGANDLFKIEGGCFNSFQIFIFNKWGEKVFESADASFSWDGIYNSSKANEGVYYYYLSGFYKNGNKASISGNVLLIR